MAYAQRFRRLSFPTVAPSKHDPTTVPDLILPSATKFVFTFAGERGAQPPETLGRHLHPSIDGQAVLGQTRALVPCLAAARSHPPSVTIRCPAFCRGPLCRPAIIVPALREASGGVSRSLLLGSELKSSKPVLPSNPVSVSFRRGSTASVYSVVKIRRTLAHLPAFCRGRSAGRYPMPALREASGGVSRSLLLGSELKPSKLVLPKLFNCQRSML